MNAMVSQITGVLIVHSIVCSDADRRKHQSSTLLAFVRGIHRWLVNSPHKGPVTRIMFPFDDVIMQPEFLLNNSILVLIHTDVMTWLIANIDAYSHTGSLHDIKKTVHWMCQYAKSSRIYVFFSYAWWRHDVETLFVSLAPSTGQ